MSEDGQSDIPRDRKLPAVLELAWEGVTGLGSQKRGRVGPGQKFSVLDIVLKTAGSREGPMKSYFETTPPQDRVATSGTSVG